MRPDNEVAESVANLIKCHIPVDAGKIRIKVQEGVVTLEGAVGWDFQRDAVEQVRCLPGVVRLDNLIDIEPGTTSGNIRKGVISSLRKGHPDADTIAVEVADNTVTLRGTVPTVAARESAQRITWAHKGVYAVVNKLLIAVNKVNSPVSPGR